MTLPIQAAGAVCWRLLDNRIEVLLVHRAFRADVSLPKGKIDPGEIPPQAAVREIKEETGLSVALGTQLCVIDYVMPNGRKKVVRYWAAEVTQQAQLESTFKPNGEIGALQWVPLRKARRLLSYDRDMDVLDRFQQLVDAGELRTYPVIVLRHAKALPMSAWDGPDATRPLLQRGIEQAKTVARQLGAWGPEQIVTSNASRCLSTVEPIAAALSLVPTVTTLISQEAHEAGKSAVAQVIRRHLKERSGVILCSHGPVIPEIIAQTAAQVGSPISAELRRGAALGTGEYLVMHLAVNPRHKGIVGVEQYSTSV